jgi:hypothetical protein
MRTHYGSWTTVCGVASDIVTEDRWDVDCGRCLRILVTQADNRAAWMRAIAEENQPGIKLPDHPDPSDWFGAPQ